MTLLDAKRGQNLGIFMSGFKMPLGELESALSLLPPQEGQLNNATNLHVPLNLSGALSMEHVTALRKLGPTPEEFEAYKKYPVSCGIVVDLLH